MKVEIKKKKADLKFPCLMIGDNESILLAIGRSPDGLLLTGVVLVSPKQYFETGYTSTNFIAGNFHPFDGELIIKND